MTDTLDLNCPVLYRRLQKYARWFARKTTQPQDRCEDLLQDTYETLLKNAHLFDPAKSSPVTFAAAVMRGCNSIRTSRTARRARISKEKFSVDHVYDTGQPARQDDIVYMKEILRHNKRIGRKPAGRVLSHSQVVNAIGLGYTTEEIAKVQGVSHQRIDQMVTRQRRKLAKAIR